MILSSRNNLFLMQFPKEFVPKEIEDRYRPYLNRIPGNLITRCIDLINYTVQGVTLPGVSYNVQQQTFVYSRQINWRDSVTEQQVLAKDVNVTFQLIDGFLNYWLMMDIYDYWYKFSTAQPWLPNGHVLRFLDSEGNIMMSVGLGRMLFNEMGGLELSHSSNTPDFQTFDCGFTFNDLDIKLELG